MLVASSTWQNPVGNFSRVLGMCRDKGLPVRTWCFQEVLKTATNPSGWMDPAFIERKRASVPAEMFRVEYELGEPAGGSRAFDLEKLNTAFIDMPIVDERHSANDDEWVSEQPQPTGWYAAGADWAKEKDKTVIVVFRTDDPLRRCVYLRRVNRKPWPEMIAMFNDVLGRYQAVSAHDGTGIGNVVNDLIDERAHKFVMVGRARTQLLVEYITAVERGVYRLPANTPHSLPTRGQQWRRCTPRGSGTVTCRMTWPRSPSRITRRTGRPRLLLGRGCRGRRTCRGRSASSRTARANRRCLRLGRCGWSRRR